MHPVEDDLPAETGKGGRHRRRSTSLRVGLVVGAVAVLVAGSAVAYAAQRDGANGHVADEAICAENCHPQAPSASPTPPAPPVGTVFSPYVDMQSDPDFDLAAAVRTAGVKQYILGFVVAGGGGCTPAWGGDTAIDDATIKSRIKGIRDAGGDFRLSFGGALGAELAQTCDSATELAAAYQRAIDTFGATMIDYDIEGDKLSDRDADVRRGQAIAILEKNAKAAGRTLNVALTLPINPSGFTASPVWMLQAAADAGANIDVVNVMAMDYGHWAAPNPEGMMGTYATWAISNARTKVMSVFGLTSEQAWKRMAVTPLIGLNDPETEVFTVADAVKLGAYAREHHAAFVSMWAITRDRPCPEGVTADAESDQCAGNATAPFVFSRAFLGGSTG